MSTEPATMNWRDHVGRFFVEFEVANHEDVVQAKKDVADRTSPVIGGSIFLKRRVRPESGGNRLDEPQGRPRTSPTTQEWGRKAAQSAQIRSL